MSQISTGGFHSDKVGISGGGCPSRDVEDDKGGSSRSEGDIGRAQRGADYRLGEVAEDSGECGKSYGPVEAVDACKLECGLGRVACLYEKLRRVGEYGKVWGDYLDIDMYFG